MSLKKQLKTVKENWLIALVILALVLFLGNFNFSTIIGSNGAVTEQGFIGRNSGNVVGFPSTFGDDFAPDVETRKITSYASVGVEVKKGDFSESEEKFNSIVEKRNALVLNRNVNSYGKGIGETRQGYYSLRIEVNYLDDLLEDLRGLGKVISFSKDATDVTGNYVSLETQLIKENERLQRFKDILSETEDVNEKITLTDKIFEQERRIAYIAEALSRQDNRIEYSTVSFNLQEKQSDFANFTFVTIGELIKSFVSSFAGLLKLIFILLPYLAIVGIIWFISRRYRR